MASRYLDVQFQVKWDGSDWASESGWTDETTNLIGASGALEVVAPGDAYLGGRQIIQEMTVTLANPNLRYSAYNTQSPLYPYLGAGGAYMKPCRLRVKMSAAEPWEPVFTGFIKSPREQFAGNRVTFRCWDLGEKLRQKHTTVMLTNKLEHEVVQAFLELAGLQDGVHFVSPSGSNPTIDYSTTPIDYAWLDDEPIWDELVDIAQASGGRIYIARDGRVHYEKDYHWSKPYGYLPEEITLSLARDFRPEYNDRAFYDEIVVEYAPRLPGNKDRELWSESRPRVVAPGETDEFMARYSLPAVKLYTPKINEDYYVKRLAGGNPTAPYTIHVTPYAQQAKVVIQNSGSEPIVVMQFKLKGRALEGLPAEQVKRKSDTPVYGRRLEIRGNPYIQTELQANAIADFLVWWFKAAKMTYTVTVPGDPRRDIGRRITVRVHHNGAQVFAKVGIVIKNDWKINVMKNGTFAYTQDITLMEDVFISGNGYFVLGDANSTLGGLKQLWH